MKLLTLLITAHFEGLLQNAHDDSTIFGMGTNQRGHKANKDNMK
jgi:hypothetical protein